MAQLAVKDIVKEFPAVRALDGVSISFEPGEVHGIVGENGAGKSTLMKILSGLQLPTSGSIGLNDQATQFNGIRDALQRGIAMIHQELNLVDELTVYENVFLGRELGRLGLLDRQKMIDQTAPLLSEVHAPFEPAAMVGELSIAGKQLVEIAKALSYSAQILIMDEPTAVLSEPESEALFALIAKLKADGVTVIYVSHRLAEVCAICDRITVLRDGKWVATLGPNAEGGGTRTSPSELASLMVGRPLSDVFPQKILSSAQTWALEVNDFHVPGHVHGVSFGVRPGEILGLAGLVGAGRTELAEAIFGVRAKQRGTMKVDGSPCSVKGPLDAMRLGIAYGSEDRKALGLILSMSTVDNTTLANLAAYGNVVIDARAEQASAERWKADLDIRANDLSAPILYLSGGNQQKVSLAKWLETKPRILILDEPTRGVDVGAKRELYLIVHRLAQEGLACIVISSEMPEIIGLCHRALVLREGVLMGALEGPDLTEDRIMHLAAAVEAA